MPSFRPPNVRDASIDAAPTKPITASSQPDSRSTPRAGSSANRHVSPTGSAPSATAAPPMPISAAPAACSSAAGPRNAQSALPTASSTQPRTSPAAIIAATCQAAASPLPGYSHSMVPGGFDVMSSTTRLTPGTSLMMRLEMRSSRS